MVASRFDFGSEPDDSKPIPSGAAAKLARMLALAEEMQGLTDGELANRVIEEVWGLEEVDTVPGALIDELLNRFEQFAGIERDDEGAIVAGGDGKPEDKG